MQVKKQQLEPCMEQLTGSGLRKEYDKAVYWLIPKEHHAKCGLDELQTGIKIPGRNINNLRYANDTILKAESKEELKNLLVRVKEESEKAGLKLSIKKTKILASSPITA